MKQSHQSLALAGLLAVVLAISGCASTHGNGDTGSAASGSSGSSGTSGSTGTYDSATSTGTDAAGIATGHAISSANAANAGNSVSSGSSGTSGISGDSGNADTASMQDDRGKRTASTTPAATPVPNSTVLAIEIQPATDGITEGDESMGATGTTGAAGTTGAGQAYRVTVRMDDGSTQVVTHNITPDFRSGDRINVTGGAIQR